MRPVELYQFTYLSQETVFTSHDTDILYGGKTWKSHAITRTAIEDTQDSGRRSVNLTLPIESPVGDIFRITSPVDSVQIKIARIDLDDPTNSYLVLFTGVLQTPTWGKEKMTMTCQPTASKTKTLGLRCKYSSTCNHTQYGGQCGLNFDDFTQSVTIASISPSGYDLTVTGLSGDASGALLKGSGGWATVSESKGGALKLFRPLPGAAKGDVLKLAPSCGQDWKKCRDTFNNLANCLAFVDVPKKNPYSGDGLKGNV